MKLMTKELEREFERIGRQDETIDPIVVAKFFNPAGAQTWLATEYDPVDRIFFGYVSLFQDYCDEWGSFSLDELEDIKVPVKIRNGEVGEDGNYRTITFHAELERDLYFRPRVFSEVWDTNKHCRKY